MTITTKMHIALLYGLIFGLALCLHFAINDLLMRKTSIQCPSESSETRDIQVTTYQL